ncbi:MAG: lamin tail domain-containing protein [Polyangiales bacterium]
MSRELACLLSSIALSGCFRVPQPEAAMPEPAASPDGSVSQELSAEGTLVRPPTGAAYAGPEHDAQGPSDAGAVGYEASLDARADAPTLTPGEPDVGGDGGGAVAMVPMFRRPSRRGDVVITEIMVNPEAVSDAEGEWFELHNPSASDGLDLSGCTVDDGSLKPHVLPTPLALAPGGFLAVGRSMRVGFAAAALLTFSLSNTADVLALACDGTEIDRVAYDASFPLAPGVSMSLDPGCSDASCNDLGSAWCLGRTAYGSGLGTPGAPNPPCDASADGDAGAG